MPRKKVCSSSIDNITPKSQSTQCNFYLNDQIECKAKASQYKQTQTEIIGTVISSSAWNDLNAFVVAKGKHNNCSTKKRKLDFVDKETITIELPKLIDNRTTEDVPPILLSEVEGYILNQNLSNIELRYLKNVRGICEQLEATPKNSLLSVSPSVHYADTPIRLLFSSNGMLSQLSLFKKPQETKFILPSDNNPTTTDCINWNVVKGALSKLSSKHVFCPGIPKDECEKRDTKTLVSIDYPFERFQSMNCPVWFVPPANVPNAKLEQRIYECGHCRALEWYLKNQKKLRGSLTPERKLKRRYAGSRCTITNLTPRSRTKRFRENRLRTYKQNQKIKELEKLLSDTRLQLQGKHNEEMTKLVSEIKHKGQEELENIFSEATSKNELLGMALRKAWETDSLHQDETNDFLKDQIKCKKGSKGNRWSALTYRIALCVFSRSPAAYEALSSFDILQLPSVSTLRAKAREIPCDEGIDLKFLRSEAKRFEDHLVCTYSGQTKPKEGVVIFDEVKVIGKLMWNSRNGKFVGCALSPEEYPSLDDLYKDVPINQVLEGEYVLQYLWRCVSTKFDIIGPYFMTSKPASNALISDTLLRVMWAFHTVGLSTIGLVCDGGSNNIAALRQSLGVAKFPTHEVKEDGSINFTITPKFRNPFKPELWVHWIVCPSHEMKNLINALQHSTDKGTRYFTKNKTHFGWDQIVDVKKREDDRRASDELAQVKGLNQSHIQRDSWTKLNVTPAKIMQQRPMLGELYSYANPKYENQPVDRDSVMECFYYLKACNDIFEEGLLSHKRADSIMSDPVQSMLKGLKYFEEWATEIIKLNGDIGRDKNFLAWQTWELLRISVLGFVGLVTDFCSRHTDEYIFPVRINGSAVETVFSQMKYIAGGKLMSSNYRSAKRSLSIKACTKTSQNCEASYRKVGLDVLYDNNTN